MRKKDTILDLVDEQLEEENTREISINS